MVRHSWHFNVVDAISIEGNCSIGNTTTNELGIDLSIKNLNQSNHSLTTEIMLHDVDLYCSAYSLNSEKIICKYFFYKISKFEFQKVESISPTT